MYAKVIVDVQSTSTAKSYDYAIPKQWQQMVRPGMRVIVPFGPRKVQGFVVGISDESLIEKVRPISDVLDATPLLTEELLQLGHWMSETLACHKAAVFQLMIPAALRTKVKKEFILTADLTLLPPSLQHFFQESERVDEEMLKNVMEDVHDALKSGALEVDYKVEEKGRKKTERYVRLTSDEKEKEPISKRAIKQRELLEYMKKIKKPLPEKDVLKEMNTSRETITELVKKGYIERFEQEVYRDPLMGRMVEKTTPLPLTDKQHRVLQPIVEAFKRKEHRTFLLHGVTGSGKTEVYLQAIERVLEDGKEAIVLVPEIALTPQMVGRFKGRFGDKVAVLHSGLSLGENYDEWRKIKRKEVQVVVGARSAIFAPFTNIGIIIIDEEHEATYKQEETPRYHARDVAIFRAKYHHIPVVLGSATPSLESYARAIKDVYELLPLTERVHNQAMPKVDVVDMREELRKGNRSMFSTLLLEKLKERLEKGEQSVLFLNRRGHSTFVICRDCGYVETCEHCDISLTYHRISNALKCHYCGFEKRMPHHCQSCSSEQIRFFGTGTQKVEEELSRMLPHAKVIRMDVDTTRRKGSHEKLLSAFGRGEANILLGTQMIAKGLDFPNITLVGVLAADAMLHLPDFRSAERTFQLLEQVSGRAGRHELAGEVVIQTYTPDHYSVQFVKNHEYEAFFNREMLHRKRGQYPPYVFLVLITISHEELPQVIRVSQKIATYLRKSLSEETVVLGPVASPLARIKDRYRYQCMIKYKNEPKLFEALQQIQTHYEREIMQKDLQITIDLNPYMFS